MKRIIILSSLLMACGVAFADNNDMSGTYTCAGTTPDNSSYNDTKVTIIKTDQTYQMSWKNPKYGSFSGTAITNPSDNSIASAFNAMKTKDTKKSGVVIYKMTDNGDLQGTWTFNTNTKLGNETCKKS